MYYVQPVSYKRYFRCNNCVLLLVYAINLSLSTDLVDPYGENTFSVKPPIGQRRKQNIRSQEGLLQLMNKKLSMVMLQKGGGGYTTYKFTDLKRPSVLPQSSYIAELCLLLLDSLLQENVI